MEKIKVQERINVKQFKDEDIVASLSVSIEQEEEDWCVIEHAGEAIGMGFESLLKLRDLIEKTSCKFIAAKDKVLEEKEQIEDSFKRYPGVMIPGKTRCL
jgi:hypothetical protein